MVNNTPAWLAAQRRGEQTQKNTSTNSQHNYSPALRDNFNQCHRLFILMGTLLKTLIKPVLRNMPLSLDNNLPEAVLRFGSTTDDEIPFSCHLDSCAGMNTGNLLLHM